VFNFFPPSYVIPGTAINAPEFAQENTAAATLRMTLADTIVRNHLTSFSIDMSPTSVLGQIASATGNAATDSANLVLRSIFSLCTIKCRRDAIGHCGPCRFYRHRPARPRGHLAGHQFKLLQDRTLDIH
jgi:hypothetical protein